MVSIMLIPDLLELATLRGGIGEFEGMPIISLRDTPSIWLECSGQKSNRCSACR